MLQYIGPVAWGCISNYAKTLPLHMFSYQVKSRLLAAFVTLTFVTDTLCDLKDVCERSP